MSILFALLVLLCASRGANAAAPNFPDCDGNNACTHVEHVCASGEACVVTCKSSRACYGMTLDATAATSLDVTCAGGSACVDMTVYGPTAPDAVVNVMCDDSFQQPKASGDGFYWNTNMCSGMNLHAADAASVSFSCNTAAPDCGWKSNIFCPGCDQEEDAGYNDYYFDYYGYRQQGQFHPGGCTGTANSGSGGGDDACSVSCTLDSGYPHDYTSTCKYMDVYSGVRGAHVTCAYQTRSKSTCYGLTLHRPQSPLTAPVRLDCSGCDHTTSPNYRCCVDATVSPMDDNCVGDASGVGSTGLVRCDPALCDIPDGAALCWKRHANGTFVHDGCADAYVDCPDHLAGPCG
jgi:hypothetical protein